MKSEEHYNMKMKNMKSEEHTKLFLSFSIPQSWERCAENLKHISEIFEAFNNTKEIFDISDIFEAFNIYQRRKEHPT